MVYLQSITAKKQIQALAPPSPLKESLPPNLINYTTIYSSNPKAAVTPQYLRSSLKSPNFMTPRTRTLYAFGESPSGDLELANTYFNNGRPI